MTRHERALRLGLRAAWARLDELAREVREHLAALEGRIDQLERQLAQERAPRRVPAAAAARRLGLSPASVRRLVESGALDGAALRLPDRERRVWVVSLESLERFERQASAPGAAGAPDRAAAGRRAPDTKG